MKNVFFSTEEITENDLLFLCYIVEKISRKLHQKNKYVVNRMGHRGLSEKMSLAGVLHSENPEKVADELIREYEMEQGTFDVMAVDDSLVKTIPTETQMGKVYKRLIIQTLQEGEDYAQGMLRVYNAPICEIIDNYNSSAYYEPSYVIAKAYQTGEF